MNRSKVIALLAGVALAVVAYAQTSGGGFPSRPRFSSVGIAAAPPSGNGGLQAARFIADTGTGGRAAAFAAGDTVGDGWLGFYEPGFATRKGYIGFGNAVNDTLEITNEETGAAIAIAATGGAVTLNGVASSDFARLSQANTFTNVVTILHNDPDVEIREQDAAADNQRWILGAGAEQYRLRVCTDAGVCTNALTVDRTGNTVDTFNLLATSVQANGAPIDSTIVCTTACSGAALAVRQSVLIVKDADTSRTSTATYAADDDLVLSDVPAGGYRFEVLYRWDSGAGGGKAQLNFTGLATDAGELQGIRRCSVGAVSAVIAGTFTTITGSSDCTAGAGNGSATLEGTFATAVATTDVSVEWAQSTSNAAATTLRRRSYLRVERLY